MSFTEHWSDSDAYTWCMVGTFARSFNWMYLLGKSATFMVMPWILDTLPGMVDLFTDQLWT